MDFLGLVGKIGTTALLVACGCPDVHLDEAWDRLSNRAVPKYPSDMVQEVRKVIEEVLNEGPY